MFVKFHTSALRSRYLFRIRERFRAWRNYVDNISRIDRARVLKDSEPDASRKSHSPAKERNARESRSVFVPASRLVFDARSRARERRDTPAGILGAPLMQFLSQAYQRCAVLLDGKQVLCFPVSFFISLLFSPRVSDFAQFSVRRWRKTHGKQARI